MNYSKLAIGAAGLILASGVLSESQAKDEPKQVQCLGVAMKAKNDCGGNGHGCSGLAKKDRDPKEWKYAASKDACEKAGGVLLEENLDKK